MKTYSQNFLFHFILTSTLTVIASAGWAQSPLKSNIGGDAGRNLTEALQIAVLEGYPNVHMSKGPPVTQYATSGKLECNSPNTDEYDECRISPAGIYFNGPDATVVLKHLDVLSQTPGGLVRFVGGRSLTGYEAEDIQLTCYVQDSDKSTGCVLSENVEGSLQARFPAPQVKEFSWFFSEFPGSMPGKKDGIESELRRQVKMKTPDALQELEVISILDTLPGKRVGSFTTGCADQRTEPRTMFSRCISVQFNKKVDLEAAQKILTDIANRFEGTQVNASALDGFVF